MGAKHPPRAGRQLRMLLAVALSTFVFCRSVRWSACLKNLHIKLLFFLSRAVCHTKCVPYSKNRGFVAFRKKQISLYEIFFCSSAIYSTRSAKNHKVTISLYDIFFCPSAIYSMRSANNHKVTISLYDIFFAQVPFIACDRRKIIK